MDLIEELRRRRSYLTTREVMGLLQIGRNTLCQWVRVGKMGAIRIGNGYLFDPHKLADWLKDRATATNNPGRAA